MLFLGLPAFFFFLNLALDDAPRVFLSVTFPENLTVKVHCKDVQLTTIDGTGAVPHKVNDISCLTRLLDSVLLTRESFIYCERASFSCSRQALQVIPLISRVAGVFEYFIYSLSTCL